MDKQIVVQGDRRIIELDFGDMIVGETYGITIEIRDSRGVVNSRTVQYEIVNPVTQRDTVPASEETTAPQPPETPTQEPETVTDTPVEQPVDTQEVPETPVDEVVENTPDQPVTSPAFPEDDSPQDLPQSEAGQASAPQTDTAS